MKPRPKPKRRNQGIMLLSIGGLLSATIAAFISSPNNTPLKMASPMLMMRPARRPPMRTRPRLILPIRHLLAREYLLNSRRWYFGRGIVNLEFLNAPVDFQTTYFAVVRLDDRRKRQPKS